MFRVGGMEAGDFERVDHIAIRKPEEETGAQEGPDPFGF